MFEQDGKIGSHYRAAALGDGDRLVTLTPRQLEVLDYLKRHAEETGLPPTRAEIAAALGFRSANAAEQHLRALARKGAIRLIPGASRGICLNPAQGLPCLKQVQPGMPLLHEAHLDKHLNLEPGLFHPPANCLVQYQGPALKAFSLLDGDWLAVNTQAVPEDGQLVLVRLREQLTVKRYKQKGVRGYLVADGPDTAAFVGTGREGVVVEGVIVGVLRLLGAASNAPV